MTTWAELAALGDGRVAYLLEVTGVGVFSTHRYTPSDTWFTDAGYTLYPYLSPRGLGPYREAIEPLEAALEVDDLQLELVDVDGVLTGLLGDWRARSWTRLTATLAHGDAAATVESTAMIPSTGRGYIGQEVVYYDVTSPTTMDLYTRGDLGTVAADHIVDYTTDPPAQPILADGPHRIVGRRCRLHAAVIDEATGAPGATTVIYRGRVGKGIRIGRGTWSVPVEHISAVLKEKAAARLPSAPIAPYQYWWGGSSYISKSFFAVIGPGGTFPYEFAVPEGSYSRDRLWLEWNIMATASAIPIPPRLEVHGEKLALCAPALAGNSLQVNIIEGSPLWALGFDAGLYCGFVGTAFEAEAQSEPRLLCIDLSDPTASPVVTVQGDVTPAAQFAAGLYVQVPGAAIARVESAWGWYIILEPRSYDPGRMPPGPAYWTAEDEEDLVLRHVFAIGFGAYARTLRGALEMMLGTATFVGPDEPPDWCAQGIVADDLDLNELDDALASVPAELLYWKDVITEGTEVWRAIGPMFALLGIYPRTTTAGRIGFVRIATPIALGAHETPLDAAVWSADDAHQVEARLDDAPMINSVLVEHSRDYRVDGSKGGFGPPITVNWQDGLGELGRTRSLKYQVPGLIIPDGDVARVGSIISSQVTATHYGVYGREAVTIDVPCTWRAKQYRCGDLVELSHELVPDTILGAIGVAGRLGLVVGRIHQLAGDGVDMLSVRFGSPTNGAGIAPCALATSWKADVKRLTFAAVDRYCEAGETDLDRFEAGMAVQLIEYDSDAPVTWSSTIAGVVGNDVILETDPFGGAFPVTGVWMTFAVWDDTGGPEREYAYHADSAAVPTLGAGGDPAKDWTI